MGFDALFRSMKQDGYHYAIEYWKLACGEFWRATYHSDFPYFELLRHEKTKVKKLVKLEAEMWIAALKCLKAINEKKHGWAPVPMHKPRHGPNNADCRRANAFLDILFWLERSRSEV
jgi:hypothetical protein